MAEPKLFSGGNLKKEKPCQPRRIHAAEIRLSAAEPYLFADIISTTFLNVNGLITFLAEFKLIIFITFFTLITLLELSELRN